MREQLDTAGVPGAAHRRPAPRVLPILTWVRGYRRAWLGRDVVAGLAAGAVVVPQAMAYASIAGLPAQFGLYTCMVPMAVYVLIGGSRTLSVSTTSTIAVLTGSTLVAAGVAAGTDDPARSLATITLIVGAILIVARVLHLGTLIDNISDATLTGIKVGVGLTVAAGQLPALLGVAADPTASNFFAEIRAVVDHLDEVSWATVAFSAGTLAMLVILRRVAPSAPGPLIAVIGGILLVAVASIDEHGIALIAHVPSGLPTPVAPTARDLQLIVPGAFAIGLMVFLETLAVARAVRRPEEPPIDNEQELTASGLASAIGAFFRAMPAAGGFSQTAINQRSGARTQLSEAVTVLLAVGCALFLGGVLSDLPAATLACMVVVAVIGLIEPAAFREFWRLSRIEFWVAVLTAAAGLCLGLLAAVLFGVILTLLLVIVELDRVGLTELQPTVAGDDVVVADETTAPEPGLLILRLDGPLYTANVRSVIRKVLEAVDARPGTDTVVVDNAAIAKISLTVMHQVDEIDDELAEHDVALWMANMAPAVVHSVAQRPRWQQRVAAGEIHATALAALARLPVDAHRLTHGGGAPHRSSPRCGSGETGDVGVATWPVVLREGTPAHRAYLSGAWAVAGLVVAAPLLAAQLGLGIASLDEPARIVQLNTVAAFAVAILGLDVVVGFAGLLSLGQSAFVGLGAYTTVILVGDHHWSFYAAVPATAVVCFAGGLLVGIPATRVKGVYLAILTLVLAFTFPSLVVRFDWLTGGSNGKGPPRTEGKLRPPSWLPLADSDRLAGPLWVYCLCIVLTVGVFVLARNVMHSRSGRAMITMRDHEPAAIALGVRVGWCKALAFGASAACGGLAGAMLMMNRPFATDAVFNYRMSIFLLAALVIGGTGTLSGAIPGALAYVFVPFFLTRWAFDQHGIPPGLRLLSRPVFALLRPAGGDAGAIFFGAALILLTFVLPGGFIAGARRIRARLVTVEPHPPWLDQLPPRPAVAPAPPVVRWSGPAVVVPDTSGPPADDAASWARRAEDTSMWARPAERPLQGAGAATEPVDLDGVPVVPVSIVPRRLDSVDEPAPAAEGGDADDPDVRWRP